MEIGDIVYVEPTNSIGIIIDKINENNENCYRTDSDGIRYQNELVLLDNIKEVNQCVIDNSPFFAPSTQKMVIDKFNKLNQKHEIIN